MVAKEREDSNEEGRELGDLKRERRGWGRRGGEGVNAGIREKHRYQFVIISDNFML